MDPSIERHVLAPDDTQSHLIVIFKTTSIARLTDTGLEPATVDVSPVQALLDRINASLMLLFGQDENRLEAHQEGLLLSLQQLNSGKSGNEGLDQEPTALATFYYVDGEAANLDDLAAELNQQDIVEAAYVVPAAAAPQYLRIDRSPAHVPSQTPDFTSRQVYRNAEDIDAQYAQQVSGGTGEGLTVIDCLNSSNTDHGTAVSGVISGDVNTFGITGIAPDAMFSGSSFNGQPYSAAIYAAANRLKPGYVILLEIHAPGPNAPRPLQGQKDSLPLNGNGGENLDSPIYNTPLNGFPSWWRNPFNLRNPSSGAILVGAECPPPEIHGCNHGPDRSRLGFSNWGSRVDCQGWGLEVTSTGYEDLKGGISPDLWYTDEFNGTSSASPIVTGAVLSVQGARKKQGRRFLTATELQDLLRRTGSKQQPSVQVGKSPKELEIGLT
ncbi:peptidase S8/S53 domain-containing protein [Aspergillus caelatus]|uniref:Peptidase S8/S53 domain-containing protein n=1 Tax=Aspergillus caelatus TaxID=61420 RepID=A0A5N6ZML7_9EURO|nr:peptidase S8/S53 domain-containing protein [Aspergillus caelatus]KAE8358861.1 peptidase S8/S53 domain-containing protein [Aspergillus caelatus]